MKFVQKHWPILLALAIQVAFFVGYYHIVLMDDMYISIRYADNLVRGFGLVYNPGERFEGYSNLLFILILAAGKILGLGYYAVAKCLSLLFASILLVLSYKFAHRHLTSFFGASAFVLWLSLDPAIIASGSIGLETSLFLCLVLSVFLAYMEGWRLSRTPLWPTLAALLMLTRPEGVVFVAITIITPGVILAFSEKRWVALATPFRNLWVLATAIFFACYTFWRYLYYGTLVTGPMLFKSANSNWVGNMRGLFQDKLAALNLFHIYYGIPLALAAYGIWYLWRNPKNSPVLKNLAIFIILAFLFGTVLHSVIFTDYANFYRYRGQIVPELLFLAIFGLERLLQSRRTIAIAFILLILGCGFVRIVRLNSEIIKFQSRNYDYQLAGNFIHNLNCHTSSPLVLSTHEAGLVPFISGLYTLDWWLNDRRAAELIAAHNPTGWRDYIISRRPDLFFVSGQGWSRELLQDFLNQDYDIIWRKTFFPTDLIIYRSKSIHCSLADGSRV